MIEREGDRLVVKVPLIMANARDLLDAGRAALGPGDCIFDFSEVTEADSSAIAVMLAWLRAAAVLRSTIKFARIPAGVLSLAELYGVNDLLPLA